MSRPQHRSRLLVGGTTCGHLLGRLVGGRSTDTGSQRIVAAHLEDVHIVDLEGSVTTRSGDLGEADSMGVVGATM